VTLGNSATRKPLGIWLIFAWFFTVAFLGLLVPLNLLSTVEANPAARGLCVILLIAAGVRSVVAGMSAWLIVRECGPWVPYRIEAAMWWCGPAYATVELYLFELVIERVGLKDAAMDQMTLLVTGGVSMAFAFWWSRYLRTNTRVATYYAAVQH
jgi:hypothetical protein